MSKKVIVAVSFVFVVGCLASYRFGVYVAQSAFENGVLETQAMLAFNHMKNYEELISCMEKGKLGEAKAKLNHSLISERELLADLLKSVNTPWLSNYIEVRSDESLDTLRSYESDRGDRWQVPTCQ